MHHVLKVEAHGLIEKDSLILFLLEVASTNLNVEVEQEDGIVEEENDQHENDTTSKTHLGQSSDSMADTFER